MYQRDRQFYDLVAGGLNALGYGNESNPFEAWVNDMFAEKYNAEATFANVGFPLNPNIPINPTYEQIEASLQIYTMASYVDIDSDGASKSTEGISLKMGGLPTFKHEISLNRKTLREQMALAEAIGHTTPEIENTVMSLMFNGVDDLLGGNYNTMMYQRDQIVSNFGKLVINASNNPYGLPLTLDFGVKNANKNTSTWYTKSGSTVTEANNIATLDPIKVMRKIRIDAQNNDFMPQGHWEVDRVTWEDVIALPYFRTMYAVATRPDITTAANQLAYGNMVSEDAIKAWLEGVIGARIEVIDHVAAVEKINATTKKAEYTNLRTFVEGVFVYVPDGAIGDVQCGKPIFIDSPSSRNALFDGGRTLIRQIFQDDTMVQTIKSEVTALCVPNKVRWFYYLTVKG